MSIIAKCTPSLGNVSIWWSRCTETIIWPTGSIGKSLFYLRDHIGGEIAEVRNGIVDSVMRFNRDEAEVSHLLWIDDDVLVFPGCLLELLSHNRDIASGVYFTKHPNRTAEPLIYPKRDGGADKFIPNRVYEVWGHGMGLTLVKLSVYERMYKELDLPKDKYGRPRWYHTPKPDDVWEDDKGIIHSGGTEDLHFLDNVSKLGIKPIVDTTAHAFGFHYRQEYVCDCGFRTPAPKLARVHKNQNISHKLNLADCGYPEEQWNQWISGQPIVWDTPEGKVQWN